MKMKKIKSMTIDMNALQLNCRKFTTSEIGRGIGIKPAKKGRRSYNRKQKYQTDEVYHKTTYLM
ncbi:hypothetical protein [Clostridium estertheticum]|uniref:hypothetical protein n=1 Tax=Clostridium estertheticum TaxID=238834 RepID=UPI0035CC697B